MSNQLYTQPFQQHFLAAIRADLLVNLLQVQAELLVLTFGPIIEAMACIVVLAERLQAGFVKMSVQFTDHMWWLTAQHNALIQKLPDCYVQAVKSCVKLNASAHCSLISIIWLVDSLCRPLALVFVLVVSALFVACRCSYVLVFALAWPTFII